MSGRVKTCEAESIVDGDACPECSAGELDRVHRTTKDGRLLTVLACDCCPWQCIEEEEEDL